MGYYCYILLCADGSFYTGWTLDPKRREKQHNQGRGAKYTRMHRPVHLVYVEEQPDQSTAMHRERTLKRLSHDQKAALAYSYRQGKMGAIPKQVQVISPGRVNMLGEHVDYNDGLVLPAAIDKEVMIHAQAREDGQIYLRALDLDEEVHMSLTSVVQKRDDRGVALPGWALYPAGVAHVLVQHDLKVGGADVEFSSNLPIGAGLSSSAAVEVGFAVMWEALGGWKLDRMKLAQYAQEAEVKYVGVNCGLMDQFACANGVEDHAMLFDTRSLEWKPVKLPEGTRIIIADSGVRHSLVSSAYNTRHEECNQAVAILKEYYPAIRALRDVSMAELEKVKSEMPENVYKRARHVVSECQRVLDAVRVLEKGDGKRFGQLMVETHISLRDDYEVSCPELDVLAAAAIEIPGCLGARITGGGFGGCTVNLVKEEAVEPFMTTLKKKYQAKTGREAVVFLCRAATGAHVVE